MSWPRLARPRNADPKRLLRDGFEVYSQCDEDGIIPASRGVAGFRLAQRVRIDELEFLDAFALDLAGIDIA